MLVERGFGASKVIEDARPPTWAIEVPVRDGSEAVRLLAGLGLPRPRPAGVKELLRPGLVPDPLEQHVLLLEAQSGELARTLEGVDGVLSARVHLVRPTPARGGGVAAPAKAAVYLRVGSSAYGRLGAMREDLRSLVAGSVEGLEPGGVTLVLSEVASPVLARSDATPLRAGVGSAASARRRGAVRGGRGGWLAPSPALSRRQGSSRAAGEPGDPPGGPGPAAGGERVRRPQAPRWAVGALEPLVLVCSGLAGARSPALLAGLLPALEQEARQLLATVDRQGELGRHASCLRVFRSRPTDHPTASDLPGRLGELVRARLGEPVCSLAEVSCAPGPWIAWSLRLALERTEEAAPPSPPGGRHIPTCGRHEQRIRP